MSRDHDRLHGKRSLHICRDKRLTLPLRVIPLKVKLQPLEQRDFEIAFFERVIERDPCHEDAIAYLGTAYTDRGDCKKGLEMDLRLVALRPEDPVAFYNLACSYCLIGEIGRALDSLKKALACGYRDLSYLENDPDLALLRKDPRYTLLRRIVSKK